MNFRRVLTALALIAVFTAVASAQIPVTQTMSCTASAQTTPTIRAEGKTELVGNLVLTCTGGPTPTAGAAVATTDITVDFSVPVTSKTADTQTEVVLTIDDPGTVSDDDAQTLGFGPNAPVTVCTTLTSCGGFVKEFAPGVWVMESAVGSDETAANVYVGQRVLDSNDKVIPNRIRFKGVPVLPVANVSFQRIYRVRNVRVNPGSAASVAATTTIKPTAGALMGLTLANTGAVTVANAQTSLTTSVSAVGASLCNAQALATADNTAPANLATLTFKENFASAFKTNESGVTYNLAPVSAAANTPTQIKAVFENVPDNVTLWVSRVPVTDFSNVPAAPAAIANLVIGEGTVTSTANGNVPVARVDVDEDGNAEVVWQVDALPEDEDEDAAVETFKFAVYAVYNLVTPPAVGNSATVALGYAPTDETDADTVDTRIPRFAAPTSDAPFLNVLPCQTSLLFPFVTNSAGFETGIAISNTSADPFTTSTSAGTCALNFYGSNAGAAFTTPSVDAGTSYANTVSGMGKVNFQGYVIGVCNFRFAHGFAFINDGRGQLAQGYLALVMGADSGRGQNLAGEALGM